MWRFRLVYVVIAVATAYHTAWSAATVIAGPQPEAFTSLVLWWAQGLAFAIAIDVSLFLTADRLREKQPGRRWYILTFVTAALVSAYFQLIYTYYHTGELLPGAGVSGEWQLRLDGLVQARIIIAPLALPFVATLYAFGGLPKVQLNPKTPKATTPKPPMPVEPIISKPPPAQLPEAVLSKREIVLAYLDTHPEAVDLSPRSLAEALFKAGTPVSKSTCHSVLIEVRGPSEKSDSD